jgi:hypothetical protein
MPPSGSGYTARAMQRMVSAGLVAVVVTAVTAHLLVLAQPVAGVSSPPTASAMVSVWTSDAGDRVPGDQHGHHTGAPGHGHGAHVEAGACLAVAALPAGAVEVPTGGCLLHGAPVATSSRAADPCGAPAAAVPPAPSPPALGVLLRV